MGVDAEALARIIRSRRSERRMNAAAIPREDLERIVDAGLFAPSAGNQQPWHFAVVTDRRRIDAMLSAVQAEVNAINGRMHSASAQKAFAAYARYLTFFGTAGAVICVFAESYRGMMERLLERYAPESRAALGIAAEEQSTAAAAQNALLTAHALGYAACWTSGPLIARGVIEKLFKPKGDWRLTALIAIGHRDDGAVTPEPPPRRPRAETVSFYTGDTE